MEGFDLFPFIISVALVLPAVFVARVLYVRFRQQPALVAAGPASAPVAPPRPEASTPVTVASEQAARARRSTSHPTAGRSMRPGLHTLQTDTVATSYAQRPFEYTIRRHLGAVRHRASNLGGYTEIPLLIHDRLGNSFIISRRLCLN